MDPTSTQPIGFDQHDLITDSDPAGMISDAFDPQRSTVEQKEAELKEMQDQIESYKQMVKQLTSQREMAIKKLADMDTQIEELSKLLESERVKVEAKDKELKTKRSMMQSLMNEENELKGKLNETKSELDSTNENLSSTQLHEKRIETKLTELQQFLATTNAAIDDIERAITYKDTIKLSAHCNQTLKPPAPLSTNSMMTNGIKSTSPGLGNSSLSPQFNDKPGAENFPDTNDPLFDGSGNFDPFANDDPFEGDDPFKSEEPNVALPEDDPFNPTSSAGAFGGFNLPKDDPFAPNTMLHGRPGL